MDFNWIWHAILIFFIGTFILRIGGRKSISQMTIAQTIVMIGLGSLLIQPLVLMESIKLHKVKEIISSKNYILKNSKVVMSPRYHFI